MCNIEDEGRCAKHNFVQVKRLSRTGDWKSLLEACPLCAMDTKGGDTALVPATPSSSEEEKKAFRVSFAEETRGLEVRKDYQFRLPESSSYQTVHSSERSIVSVSSAQSSNSARPALKTPKYKACPIKQEEHRNLEVTTMSMDLDIHDDSEDEDENEVSQLHLKHPPPPKQPKRNPPPPPRRESRHKEQKSKVNPRMIGKSPVRALRRSDASLSSLKEVVRPDPVQEFDQSTLAICPAEVDHVSVSSGPYITTRDVSDDVSAISFMGSVYSNNQAHLFNALVPFQEEVIEEESPEDNDFDFDNDQSICSSTNNYDSKGRCVRHPHVRLRKKKFLGRGWKVLMSACPDCCVDELRKLHASKSSKVLQKPKKKTAMPRDSIKDRESDDTASLSLSSQGSVNGNQVSAAKKREEQDGIFVKNMAWTDLKGRRGSYTGEVNSQFIPNGRGSMEYENSTVKEGVWKDGGRKSRSRSKSIERSSRSRSVSVHAGSRSRSISVTPRSRARSTSRVRVSPEF